MPRRIAFVVAEDRLFASDCLPLVVAGRELGLDVDVIAPLGPHRDAIELAGARVVPLRMELRRFNPMTAGFTAGQLASVLKRLAPDLVHCVGVAPSLVGGSACVMAGIERRVYGLKDLGTLPFRRGMAGKLLRRALGILLTGPLRSPGTRFLVAGEASAAILKRSGSTEIAIAGAAGIDPEVLRPLPMPSLPPLRIAVVDAVGAGIAAQAARLARTAGVVFELSTIGFLDDAAEFWGSHHVACLPSRAPDGLPKGLLEAAACGRPIVMCGGSGRHGFVTDGLEGYVVPPDDPAALADAFGRLAADPVLLPRMGSAARARVLHGFTERDVTEAAKRLYAAMLAR